MLGLHLADDGRIAAFVVLGLSLIVFFVIAGASGAPRSPRRRRFRTAYWFGGPYWNQGFGLANPVRQLHAVEAASFQKQRVLNGSEYRVFKIIEDEVATCCKGHRVFAQTCLGEILKSSNQDAFHSINSKRADILVIDGGGWPVLAVEYQGDGHYQGAAATRDAIKKEALRKAGVRHLEVYPADTDNDIRSRVRGQLSSKTAPEFRSEAPPVTPVTVA